MAASSSNGAKNTVVSCDANVVDDAFDDACDLGQFFLNPCWYVFVKLQKLLRKQSKVDDDRTRKTKFLSNLQQAFYLLAFYLCWAVIFTRAYPRIRESDQVSNIHLLFGYVIFAACITSWMGAKWTPPGTITEGTLWKYDNYLYDGVLYTHGSICPTLGIRKLARSKYDRFSQTHVPRFDHFCGWLGTTIGEENYRCFLAFTASHTVLFTYGAVILFWLQWTTHSTDAEDLYYFLNRLVATACADGATTAIGVLCAVMACPALDMTRFHLLLLSQGMTTNEYYKWKAILAPKGTTASNSTPPALVEDVECSSKQQPRPAAATKLQQSPSGSAKHFYNLGLMGNIHEVLFPRSLREGFKKKS